MSIAATGPNAEMIRYWNEQSGAKWVALEAYLDAQIEPLGRLAMERTRLVPGERIVDVGCGCGQTSLQLAERVGPEGSVLGMDLSAVMLERARERARQAGHSAVRFENADAQTARFDTEGFDVVFSRFGVMFFSDPTAAFANLRQALVPGGRLAFVCWQGIEHNPWMLVPVAAAAQHVPMPPRPEPGAPGPFSFADPERVRGILEGAGFEELGFEPHERELRVGGGGTLDEAVEFLLQMGPTGAALREAEASGAELRSKVTAAVREAVEPFATDDGLRMQSACWIVTARAR